MNRKRKIYILIISIPAILIILSFPLIISQIRFHNVLADLKAQGIPITAKEFFDKHYEPVPEEQNAAVKLKKAFTLYKEPSSELLDKLMSVGLVSTPRFDQRANSELIEISKYHVNKNKDYFAELDKTKNYEYLRFKHKNKLFYGKDSVECHLKEFREIFRNYIIKTEIAIADGNMAKAKEVVNRLFYFGNLASQTPTSLGQLVFYGCICFELNNFQRYLNNFFPEDIELKGIQSILNEQEKMLNRSIMNIFEINILEIIYIDRLFFPSLEKYCHVDGSGFWEKIKLDCYYLAGCITNSSVEELKLMHELTELPLNDFRNNRGKLENIKSKAENLFNVKDYSIADSCKGVVEKKTEIVAEVRCAITACAIERFYLKYKKLPENLDKLVPEFISEVPVDPFNGEKLSYYQGEFELEYEIPTVLKKMGEVNKESAEFRRFEYGKSVKYTKVVKKKKGYVVHSVGRDLKANITFPLNGNPYHDKDTVFIVVKQ
jgi:hypothetical protein